MNIDGLRLLFLPFGFLKSSPNGLDLCSLPPSISQSNLAEIYYNAMTSLILSGAFRLARHMAINNGACFNRHTFTLDVCFGCTFAFKRCILSHQVAGESAADCDVLCSDFAVYVPVFSYKESIGAEITCDLTAKLKNTLCG